MQVKSIGQVGKYILLESIGRGGMGEVFLAKGPGVEGISKFFAVKVIRSDLELNSEIASMFKKEAQLAIKLNHSNLVSMIEFGIFKNRFFIAMDYIPGFSLFWLNEALIGRQRRLGVAMALYVGRCVAEGLSYAHNFVDLETGRPACIVHRDISPQNVLISLTGEIKVIDFGVAKLSIDDKQTDSGVVVGKYDYLSPEGIKGASLDGRADLFSLCIVLWELLNGRRMYWGLNPAEMRDKLLNQPAEPVVLSDKILERELNAVLLKGLEKNSANRIKSADELSEGISRILTRHFPGFTPNHFKRFVIETFRPEADALQAKLQTYSGVHGFSEGHVDLEKTVVSGQNLTSLDYSRASQMPGMDYQTVKPRHIGRAIFRTTTIGLGLILLFLAARLVQRAADYTKWISQEFQAQVVKANSPSPSEEFVKAEMEKLAALEVQKLKMNEEHSAVSKAQPEKVELPAADVPKTLKVWIRSQPSGAEIRINGKLYRARTPVDVPFDPEKSYRVELRKPGFRTFSTYYRPDNRPLWVELEAVQRGTASESGTRK